MQQILSIETLGSLDGGIAGHLVNAEIARAVADLQDRGHEDGQPRKVVISLELSMHEGLVVTQVVAQAKLPPRKSHATAAKVRTEKGREVLLFQDLPGTHPDQMTFDDTKAPGEL